MSTRIQVRRDLVANWVSVNPVLYNGEIGFATDLGKFKIGDGSTTWNSLAYAAILPSEITELAQDALSTSLTGGSGISVSYNDAANTLTVANTGTLSFNTRTGAVTLTANDVDVALGYVAVSPTALSNSSTAAISSAAQYTDSQIIAEVSSRDAAIATAKSESISSSNSTTSTKIGDNTVDGTLGNTIINRIATSKSEAITSSNGYTDQAITSLGNTSDATYVPLSDVANADGVASLDSTGNVPISQLGNLIAGAPDLLNTLDEIAAAINDDATISQTLTTAIGTKQDKVTGVSDTEIGYLDGVTSAIQTQINSKFASADASTTNVTEGTNLYFTDERAQDAVGNVVGTGLTYTDSTGAISVTANTFDAFGAAASAQTAAESSASGYVSTHAGLTETHGATGAVVGTTNAQTLTNKTLTSPKINEEVALTATATELNVLDGITSTTAELNILDGVTASTTELNYIDGVTSGIQTQLNDKAPLDSPTFTTKVNVNTNNLNVGSASEGLRTSDELTNPIAVFSMDADNDYAQLAVKNTGSGANSSTDVIAYATNGDDTAGWIDMGITSPSFSDPEFTITGKNDGYLFMEAPVTINASINNKELTTNVVTLTTSADHGFTAGKKVTIAGLGAPFDGVYPIISTPTNTTFTYQKPNADITSAAVSPAGTATEHSGDGNLVFATGANGAKNQIVFAAGGLQSDNTQMTIIPDQNVHIEIATESDSATTGALTVAGGAGITGNLSIDGISRLTDTIYVGPDAETFDSTAELTNPGAVISLSGGPYAQLAVHNSTASSSADIIAYANNGSDTSGWIDMGITGESFSQSEFGITSANDGYIFMEAPEGTSGAGNLVIATGAKGTANKIIFAAGGFDSGLTQMEITPDENVHIEIDTPSTSPATGALTVVGGVGISGDMNIQGDVDIQGTITFGGAGTTVETANLSVTDPLVYVGAENASDIVDLGLVGEYTASGTTKYAGVVRDASDGVIKFFKDTTTKPTTSVDFTTTALADIKVAGLDATSITIGGVSNTEIGYLDGVTSAIQTQINDKAPLAGPTFTGTVILPGTTSIGNITSTELGYIDGVTSAIQTQIDAKAPSANPAFTGNVNLPSTTSIGDVSATELGYIDGVTSAIQTQLNNKQAVVANVSDTEIGYLDGVTSSIQTQLNDKAPLNSPTFTGTVTLPANTISQSMMGDDSVGTNEIGGSAVTEAKIADDAVTAQKIKDGAVTSAKIANDTIVDADINSAAAIAQSKISGLTTDLSSKLALAGGTMTGAITLHADPSSSLHAATKQYVDNTASGIVAKPQVLGATTANINATYNNGTAGVGATLTHNTNGAFPAESGGASGWAVGKGILVKNQTNKAQNGRYYVSDMGSASTPYVLTRCGYCDEADEIPGAYIFVQDGTNAGTGWIQVVADPTTFVVGTDNIDVFQFSGSGTITAGTGITVSGNEVSISTGAITSSLISDGTIVDGDINASAAIAQSKISGLTSALGDKAPLAGPTFTGTVVLPSTTSIGNVSSTEIGYVDGVTSGIQSQLDGKSPTAGNTSLVTLGTVTTGTWNATTIAVNKGGTGATDAATARINLGGTTVGANVFTLTNPSAITFLKINADNTISTESAATYKTSLSLNNVENTAISTWAGSTNIITLGTIAAGTWNATAIGTTKGGTGLTSYTTGDVVYASASNTLSKLAVGTSGQILTVNAGVPSWQDAPITLPSQTGNTGKYLTTDGSSASWGTLEMPAESINAFMLMGA
jgi:hypothetical protein